MKKYMQMLFSTVKIIAVGVLFLFCILFPESVGKSASEALQRCLNSVIPSLCVMMMISAIIVRSGILSFTPRIADRASALLFGIEGYVMTVFTFSMFAGYPVGASMLMERQKSGALSKERASLLAGLCFGAGPAFVYGCISGRYYSSPTAGIIITVSAVSANLILALVLSPLLRKERDSRTCAKGKVRLTADMLTDCIVSGGRSMAVVCFAIMFFSAVSALLDRAGIYSRGAAALSHISGLSRETASALLHGLTDITATGSLPCDDYTLLPYLSALVSLGGICVLFQISALVRGRLSMKPIILIRSAAAILSGIICRLITPFFLRHELKAVSMIRVRTFSTPSPVPSIMLIIMMFMLFMTRQKPESNS